MKLVKTNAQQGESRQLPKRALLNNTATVRLNQETVDQIAAVTELANSTYGMRITKSDIIKRAIKLGLLQLEITLKQQSGSVTEGK
ncbi:MAG: hypothetical protein H7235_07675 [Bdellovibrionaceae bacterium]|nr:hypothetical protein [Pseudobdellovibrionaceae bacterium]